MTDPATSPDVTRKSEFDPRSLPVDEARRRILAAVAPVAGYEKLALRSALGRVLLEDVRSTLDVPVHDNAGMDGYAVAVADLPETGERGLEVIGTAMAGAPFHGALAPGQCVRIMTGAVLPRGADTVVMQEHARREGDTVWLGSGYRRGENVRHAGEDLATGDIVLAGGHRLTPSDLGLLASLGVAEVEVRRRPRAAFFSTGDELRSIGEALAEGQIYDSNRYTLYGMLTRLGTEVIDMGVVRDRREEVREAFLEAARVADVIITSGGVSVGEADYVKETLEAVGAVSFWKIAMKPGRPLAFGNVGDAVFFGLPGNPVSVMVTFYQFVQPALLRLSGEVPQAPFSLRVPCAQRLTKRPGRVDFQRGILETRADGQLIVRSTGEQGSGILSSMSRANCFIVLPLESTGAAPGDVVEVQPFAGVT